MLSRRKSCKPAGEADQKKGKASQRTGITRCDRFDWLILIALLINPQNHLFQ
jgi:hypothetical protein